MTRRDLVKSAIRHEDNARTPYAINLTQEGYSAYGARLMNDYPNKQAQKDLRDGMLTLEQAVSLSIGNHMVYVYPPWWRWENLTDRFLKDEDTPETLPDTIGYGDYEKFFAQTRHIRDHYDVYQIATIWGSHWEKAYFARGIENFLYDLAADPEWSQSLLDLIIQKNIVMLQNILTDPHLDAVLLGSDWGTQRDLIISPDCFRRALKPGEEREYQLVHHYKKDVIIHSCGNIEKIMPDLVQMKVDMLNPVQPECMDLATLKQSYGDQICFYGGISTQQTLPFGTPEEVAKETERVIGILHESGGYITAPSQEIQTDVPYENLCALIDTAKKHS